MKKKLALLTFLFLIAETQSLYANSTPPIKNFRELFESWALSTQVDPLDPLISSTFATEKMQLPREGVLDELTDAVLLASVRVSRTFCQKLIEKDAVLPPEQRWAHSTVNFSLGPKEAFSTEVRDLLLKRYADLFWTRNLTSTEKVAMDPLFLKLVETAANEPQGTTDVLTMLCVSFAISVDSFLQ